MSDRVVKTPEESWRNLKENGVKLLIDFEDSGNNPDEKPLWFDEVKFARAKLAVEKFFIGVQYSSLTGLLMILQLPDGLEPLLSTGNSKDIPSLFKRYLSTINHVNSWYEDDIFDPETKGYKSIRQVRKMHKRVQTTMNNKFKVMDMHGTERNWFNQYEVAMTQFAFIGLAMVFPSKCAMIAATKEELELINYYWRVLGYMMGIKDEFNACQFDKYEEIHEFFRLLFQHEYLDNYKEHDCKTGLEMSQAICTALQDYMPLLTFNSLSHWWKDVFLFNGYQPKPLTMREKVLDMTTKLSFNHMLKNEKILKLSNKLHKRRFEAKLNNKDKIYDKLVSQYRDKTDSNLRFYSDRVDYFDDNFGKSKNGVIIGKFKTNKASNLVDNNESKEAVSGCPFLHKSKLQDVSA